MFKLIREDVTDVQVLVEEDKSTGKKNYFIEGIFMQAERQNKNGRVYPMRVLQNEVNRYNNEYVLKNRAFGELGHPDTPSINLERDIVTGKGEKDPEKGSEKTLKPCAYKRLERGHDPCDSVPFA